MTKTRNPIIRHSAVLRKGGPHTRSSTAQRHSTRLVAEDEAQEFMLERRKRTIAGAREVSSGDAAVEHRYA